MIGSQPNNYPKLHNAAWPGVVGKGDGGEPTIDLDTMLDMTAAAEVDGVKFDGIDLFLALPHFDIDAAQTDDGLVLVDTGFGVTDCTRPSGLMRAFASVIGAPLKIDETAIQQIKQLGYQTSDVKHRTED